MNTLEAYIHDVDKLVQYFKMTGKNVDAISTDDLRDFLVWLHELGILAPSQARILSGLKAFFMYLLLEGIITNNPAAFLSSPRITRKIPDTLSIIDINKLIDAIDLSKAEGMRNKAMIEVLYGCGLRVSELTKLRLSNLYITLLLIFYC